MHGALGITRIVDAGGQTIGHFEPALDLAQNQQTAIGGQTAAVEAGDDLFAGNQAAAAYDQPWRVGAPETTWTGFSNRILRDSNGLRYTRQPRCIIRASIIGRYDAIRSSREYRQEPRSVV